MKVVVKIVNDSNKKPDSNEPKQAINVETHDRRGDDMFAVQKADTMMEGEERTFVLANAGRLVVTLPQAGGEVVMDHGQNAAVVSGQQESSDNKADAPQPNVQKPDAQKTVEPLPNAAPPTPAVSGSSPPPVPGTAPKEDTSVKKVDAKSTSNATTAPSPVTGGTSTRDLK